MKPTTWIIGGALLLAGLGTGGYVYLNGDQKAPARYKTAKIERGTVTQTVTATGTINPVSSAIPSGVNHLSSPQRILSSFS